LSRISKAEHLVEMTATISKYLAQSPTAAVDQPAVTAIMIFFNAERFIDEAIASVLEQTFEGWELVLVDDGSTDRSSHIAQHYANRYPERMRYLEHPRHENRGMSSSRNLGLRHARGEFIAFLDSDDVWFPRKLEEQLEILKSHPQAAMVYGATQYWYSWTGMAEDERRDFVHPLGVPADTLVNPPYLARVLLQNQVVTTTGSLARREIFQQLGGYEEGFRGMFEDQIFYSKVSLKLPIFVSSQCWYKYRRHSDSCCAIAEASGRHHGERLSFLKWLETYSSEQGVEDVELRRAIKNEQWKSRYPALARLREQLNYRASMLFQRLKSLARHVIPGPLYRLLRSSRHRVEDSPDVGTVRFGDLRRLNPISRVFGFDRGTPIDRYYIEKFLARYAADIRGRVLEVGDDSYTREFGGGRVTQSDVLHVSENNPHATIVADLADAAHVPSNSFDCIVLTQTLHLIYDVRAAVSTLHRILRPGGVLLATIPGITQIDRYDWAESWYWAFTSL